MSVFTTCHLYDMMDTYAQVQRAEYKKFLDSVVEEAVDYYADVIREDKVTIMNDLMEAIASGDTHNGVAKAVVKKTYTFHHAKNTKYSRHVTRNAINAFGDANGHFAWTETGPLVNLYVLYKHTDFARKLADRIGGDRFSISVTSTFDRFVCDEEVERYNNMLMIHVDLNKTV